MALAGTIILMVPACTNSAETKDTTAIQNEQVNEEESDNDSQLKVNLWAKPASGKIPFSADMQNLLSQRHRVMLAKLTTGNKDDQSPQFYVVKANELMAFQKGIASQAAQYGWQNVEQLPATHLSETEEGQLKGSWAAAWRKPDGNLIIVSGLDASQANAAGDVPVLIDEAR